MVDQGNPAKRGRTFDAVLVCIAAGLAFPTVAFAGSARDYLNAPVDAWLVMYNAGYVTSVTPEDGTDISSRTVSNAFLQSVVLTRTMDFWNRAGGLSIVLPHAVANTSSSAFQGSTNGVSDVALLWQINIFGGPALTREQFRSFVPQTFSSFIFTSERRSAPTIRIRRSIRARTVGWFRRPSITAIRRTAAGHGSRLISPRNFSRTTTISS